MADDRARRGRVCWLPEAINSSRGESNPSETASRCESPAATASSSRVDDPDPATAWEATAGDIDTYREDLTPFEKRSQQLWDATPELKQE